MQDPLATFIKKTFVIPATDGEDKRCTPQEAIARHITPRMKLYVPCGAALLNPLIRHFWGQQPDSTIITTGVTLQLHAMIHGGLVKKASLSAPRRLFPATMSAGTRTWCASPQDLCWPYARPLSDCIPTASPSTD
ncbi:uncharacterized protein Dvar_34620 [Desulfosarcina variabilis str. Montpellier]|uniref:hypothetical protein n=1 Tax=Desulfosarcina variabilis TaxID=2300 RepID=UPI003AFB2EE4